MVIKQYDIFQVNLDPAVGREMKKTRPCLVISPNDTNDFLGTIIIAPLTTKYHPYPTRIKTTLNKKEGWIVLDQIKTLDKKRFIKKLGHLNDTAAGNVKSIIKEMLVD